MHQLDVVVVVDVHGAFNVCKTEIAIQRLGTSGRGTSHDAHQTFEQRWGLLVRVERVCGGGCEGCMKGVINMEGL